jgi:hypothetical protein
VSPLLDPLPLKFYFYKFYKFDANILACARKNEVLAKKNKKNKDDWQACSTVAAQV